MAGLCVLLALASTTPASARLIHIKGGTDVRRLIHIKGGTDVRRTADGYSIQTGASDRVALLFDDGSVVKLNGNTILEVPGERQQLSSHRFYAAPKALETSTQSRYAATPTSLTEPLRDHTTLDEIAHEVRARGSCASEASSCAIRTPSASDAPPTWETIAVGPIPSQLLLRRGEIWQDVIPGRAVRTEMRVGTTAGPVADSGNAGASLNLRLAADGSATLTVGDGAVTFAGSGAEVGAPTAVVVRKAQQSVAAPGRAPSPPIAVDLPTILEWTNDVQPIAPLLEMTFVSQDPERLAAALREAEAVGPGPEQRLRLADIHHDRGELQAALGAYEAVLSATPETERQTQAMLHARIGQTLLEIGTLPRAEAAFRTSIELWRDQATPEQGTPARTGLVLTLLGRRQTSAALTEARAAVAADERAPMARTALAIAQIRAGDREAARGSLERAIALDPGYAPARTWLSFLLRTEERLEEAYAAAQEAVRLAPHSSHARQSLADVAFARGDTRGARRSAERAVALNPRSPGARVLLGRALVQEGRLDAAARSAEQAVSIDPDLDRAQFFLGLVRYEQRRLAGATAAFRRAVELDAAYLEARAYLARALLDQGRRSEAIRIARDATVRDPDFAPVRAALGRVKWRAGLLSEAKAEYQAALRLAPQSALYSLELAELLLQANDLPGALAAALRATERAPGAAEAHAVLGLVYDRMENTEQAQREYREAISRSPENALARIGLGLVNAGRSDRLRELRRLLAGQRDGAELQRRLLQFIDSDLTAADGARELGQGLLRDPSVLTRVFEPGVTTEIAPGIATRETVSLGVTHRDQFAAGRLHDLFIAARESGKNYRDHRSEQRATAWLNLAAAPDYRTHLLGQYLYLEKENPQPGALANPDRDDRSAFWDNWWDLSARRQTDARTSLWFHAGNRLSHSVDQNPDAPLDGDLTRDSRARFRQLVLEARLDRRWGGGHTTRYLLSAGRFQLGGVERNYELPRRAFVDRETTGRGQAVQHTLQHDYHAGGRLSLVTGVTAERYTQRARIGVVGGLLRDVGFPGETRYYPYGQLTYRLTEHDQVRLLANRRRRRPLDFLLTPSEAFLVAEPTALTVGGAATTYEADYERRLSARDYAKLFFFRGDLEEWFVAPFLRQTPDLLGFRFRQARSQGFGLRYERQIFPTLSGYLRYTYRRATDETAREQEARFTRGLQVLMIPRSRALLGLNYVDRSGTKVLLETTWTSRFRIDRTGEAPQFPSRCMLDLRLGREPSVRREWTVTIRNLLNTSTIYWPDFPAPGRTYELQYRLRF